MRQSGKEVEAEGPVSRFLRLIRFSHTIFALPFALGALVVAANGWPSLRILVLVMFCMVFARTAAMLFNRVVDWSLDQRNPRTASRHLLISKPVAIILLAVSSGGFLLAAAAINRLTLVLAPIALVTDFFLLADETVHERYALFSRPGASHRTNRRMDRANWPDRSRPGCARGRRNLLGSRIRSHLRYARLRFRSARRYSIACCETRDRPESSPGAVIASPNVSYTYFFRRGGAPWPALFLVDAAHCRSAFLRTQNRKARCTWHQSGFFSEQRVCQRGFSRCGLRGSIALAEGD